MKTTRIFPFLGLQSRIKIRNSNFEIRNKFEYQMKEFSKLIQRIASWYDFAILECFGILNFENLILFRASDFVFRFFIFTYKLFPLNNLKYLILKLWNQIHLIFFWSTPGSMISPRMTSGPSRWACSPWQRCSDPMVCLYPTSIVWTGFIRKRLPVTRRRATAGDPI